MQFHPIADIFPMMTEDEFARFCDDIRANGLREDIWTHDGKIIDGRNRYKACFLTNTPPRFREYKGEESGLIPFVISLNLHRRHLSESQRAMIAAKLANLEKGNPKLSNSANLPNCVSQTSAAEMLNVSTRTVTAAARVRDEGSKELVEAVERGEIKVGAAALLTELPKEEQANLIKSGGVAKARFVAGGIRHRKLAKKIAHSRKNCVVCNLHIEATEETFLKHLEVLKKRFPKFARYILNLIEDIEANEEEEEARTEYALIFAALDKGFNEFHLLHQRIGITKDRLRYLLQLMLDSGDISHDKQGGKPDAARGSRKDLYFRTEKSYSWTERG